MKNEKDTITVDSAEAAKTELSPEQYNLVKGHGGEINETLGSLYALVTTLEKKENRWMIDWIKKHRGNHGYAKFFTDYGDNLIEIGNALNKLLSTHS